MSATQSIARFMSTPLEERLSRDHLLHARERLLDLFRRTVREVPAYREFLATQQFDPAWVRTYEDFARLPPSVPANSSTSLRSRSVTKNRADLLPLLKSAQLQADRNQPRIAPPKVFPNSPGG